MMPHDNVYTRIGICKTHGIGVLCIKKIPKGEVIFEGGNAPVAWVKFADIEHIEYNLKKLYTDFGIRRGDYIGIPSSFNNMTIGWYLNHNAESPNVDYNKENYHFYAKRDIEVGEELTADYNLYCDNVLYNHFAI